MLANTCGRTQVHSQTAEPPPSSHETCPDTSRGDRVKSDKTR